MRTAAPGRRLSVLAVAFPFAPVGPGAAGGAEQVLSALDRALVAAGHRSIVLACDGSEVAGELVPIPAVHDKPIDDAAKGAQHAVVRACIEQLARGRDIDLIHVHGMDFSGYFPPPGPPVLATLHLPPEWHSADALSPQRPNTWLNCVSGTQHRALLAHLAVPGADPLASLAPKLGSAAPLEYHFRGKDGIEAHEAAALRPPEWVLPPIPNGVDVEALAAEPPGRRAYALMLGRICWEKGQHLAMDAARIAGVPLLVAGQVFSYPEHTAYFEAEIRPRLGRMCRLVGPVGFARKRRLLASARCVLLPSRAPETSSLVAMEAAACGTPVVAFAVGALSDIVVHGRTGFLVRDLDGMAEAIGLTGSIDPNDCRQVARERFVLARTTAAYLALYRRLADGEVGKLSGPAAPE